MANIITINNQDLVLRQYNGQMVITFKDIDLVHNRPQGTARRNFNTNKSHFIEGEDYFKIQPNEIRTVGIQSPNGGIVVTESGYLMLVKSFTDNLSWEVQRQLVKTYFRCKEQQNSTEQKEDKPYEYFDKTYNGVPVLTTADVEYLTKINRATIDWNLKTKLMRNKDYYHITGDEPKCFEIKSEKPSETAEDDLSAMIDHIKKVMISIDTALDEIKSIDTNSQTGQEIKKCICKTATYYGFTVSSKLYYLKEKIFKVS